MLCFGTETGNLEDIVAPPHTCLDLPPGPRMNIYYSKNSVIDGNKTRITTRTTSDPTKYSTAL